LRRVAFAHGPEVEVGISRRDFLIRLYLKFRKPLQKLLFFSTATVQSALRFGYWRHPGRLEPGITVKNFKFGTSVVLVLHPSRK